MVLHAQKVFGFRPFFILASQHIRECLIVSDEQIIASPVVILWRHKHKRIILERFLESIDRFPYI